MKLKIEPDRIWISEAAESEEGIVAEILDEAGRWLKDNGIRQWTVPFSEEYIRGKIAAREFHLINIEGKSAGVFRLLWSDFEFWDEVPENAAYIHTLAVRREYAGRGLVERAIEWAAERARQEGKQYLRLDCMANNEPLKKYYERLGFEPAGCRRVRDFQVVLWQRTI